MLYNQLNGQGCYVLLEVYDAHVFIKECYTCDNIKCRIVKTLASPFDYGSYLCFLWPPWTGKKATYDVQNIG